MITFVTGPPRSGTTMVAAALNRGTALPECTIIASMIMHRLSFSSENQGGRFTHYLGSGEMLDAHLADLFEAMVAHASGKDPVLKAPELTAVLPHLHCFFRQPIRTVCLVRDPRDAIASLMKVRERQGEPRDLVAAADFLGVYYQRIADTLDSPHDANPVLLVRYEEFVRGTGPIRAELQSFTGRPLAEHGVLAESIRQQGPWYSDLYSKPITAERIGSYMDYLTPDEIGAIDESYARFYERFGYARHEETPSVSRAA